MSASGGINQGIGDLVATVVSDGANPPVIQTSLGVNSQTDTPAGVVRNAKGDYTINFPKSQCDVLSRHDMVCAGNATANIAVIGTGATDSTAKVLVFDAAGAAADGEFHFQSTRIKD